MDYTSIGWLISATTAPLLALASTMVIYDRYVTKRHEDSNGSHIKSEGRSRLPKQSQTKWAVFLLDADGKISTWNSLAMRLCGYKTTQIVGVSYSCLFTAEERKAGKPEQALKIAELDGEFEEENWRVRSDGYRFWANVKIESVKDDAGNLLGFSHAVRRIIGEKRDQSISLNAQEALTHSQRSDLIRQITSGIAHEFNDLFVAIRGNIELLEGRLPNDPRIARLFDDVGQWAQWGMTRTQCMLAFSRELTPKPEAVDLPELVRAMMALLRSSTGPAIKIEAKFGVDVPKVMVDIDQLALALLNFVLNARDAMPGGGVITIGGRNAGRNTEVGLRGGRYFSLFVIDTGMGMDEVTVARASEPFFTTKAVGTGLGLAMGRAVAEWSGGRLDLTSRVGKGTTVELWLPVAGEVRDTNLLVGPFPNSRDITSRLTILVVDDNSKYLEYTAANLEELGHSVIEAHSGDEALALLRWVRGFDLVVTDYLMPGMTGIQLIERMKSTQPHLRFLLTTSFLQAAPKTPDGLVQLKKPFDQLALVQAVDAAMGKEKRAGIVLPFRRK